MPRQRDYQHVIVDSKLAPAQADALAGAALSARTSPSSEASRSWSATAAYPTRGSGDAGRLVARWSAFHARLLSVVWCSLVARNVANGVSSSCLQ